MASALGLFIWMWERIYSFIASMTSVLVLGKLNQKPNYYFMPWLVGCWKKIKFHTVTTNNPFPRRVWLDYGVRSHWVPVWITLPEVSNACRELVKCSCKYNCTRCSNCLKAYLNSTTLYLQVPQGQPELSTTLYLQVQEQHRLSGFIN